MSQPPSKRSRSSDSVGCTVSHSGDQTATTLSRDAKYSTYKDVNYTVVLETKNSFMRMSKSGIVDEDRKMCDKLLLTEQPIPLDSMFDDDRFQEFCSLLHGRSEAQVYIYLHPLLVPSAENLCISGQRKFQNLIEGYNDRWIKAIPFYGSLPQPDHTFGFKWSTFTAEQRHKLGIKPIVKSYFTAREDIYFPFLTSEVKCGKQALDVADRANANSMTIAVRGVVELFRMVGRPMDIHRRVLGFSISHDDNIVRLYAHYPEIDGDKTSFWQYQIRHFAFNDQGGKEKWKCRTTTLNICDSFAADHLKRILSAVDELPDPIEGSSDSAIAPDEETTPSTQESASSAPKSQEDEFKKPRQTKALTEELRTVIQSLQQQLEQQRKKLEQQGEEPTELIKRRVS